MKKLPDETHPGEMLPEEFMKPMGIAARRLNELLGGALARICISLLTLASR